MKGNTLIVWDEITSFRANSFKYPVDTEAVRLRTSSLAEEEYRAESLGNREREYLSLH